MKKSILDMIRDIESEVFYTRHYIGKDKLDQRVMQAMKKVPREKFVAPDMQYAAFDNGPLPIGHGQTISQPYIVALMTDMLVPKPDHCILEIGTGSGYQTAILSLLCKQVYSIERIPELGKSAAQRLQKMGYHNIETRIGNGYEGWPEQAPYDGIVVTAAASHIPEALTKQLKPGGRMAIPVGEPHGFQELILVRKNEQGQIREQPVLGVAFVPLVNSASSANYALINTDQPQQYH